MWIDGQTELYWAVATTTGGAASLYVNTADPGNVYNGTLILDWPKSSTSSDPYGQCTDTTFNSQPVGANTTACAWQYGYNRAAQDAMWLSNAADAINGLAAPPPVAVPNLPGDYPW